jgi:hypothetical protein
MYRHIRKSPPPVVQLDGEKRNNLMRSLQRFGTKLSEDKDGAVWVQDGRVWIVRADSAENKGDYFDYLESVRGDTVPVFKTHTVRYKSASDLFKPYPSAQAAFKQSDGTSFYTGPDDILHLVPKRIIMADLEGIKKDIQALQTIEQIDSVQRILLGMEEDTLFMIDL